MLKNLYHWTLSLAQSRHAPLALGLIAFAESSFFPIPPDALLVPMSVAQPKKAWTYALICTLGSVLGGILGYAIGALLFDSVGQWLINLYGYGEKMGALKTFYDEYGAWFILLKGLTPIPFKLVTIVSGVLHYNFPLFVLLCLVTRGARFFILALLMNKFGEPIKAALEKYFGGFLLILAVAVVGGFWLAARAL